MLQVDHFPVAASREVAGFIQHVGDAARHTRAEVATGGAQHDHPPARHIFAAVIADRLDHRVHATVSDAEPLAGHPTDVSLPLVAP